LVWPRSERDLESKLRRRRTEARRFGVLADALPDTRPRRLTNKLIAAYIIHALNVMDLLFGLWCVVLRG
jgi:hypothetical protein